MCNLMGDTVDTEQGFIVALPQYKDTLFVWSEPMLN